MTLRLRSPPFPGRPLGDPDAPQLAEVLQLVTYNPFAIAFHEYAAIWRDVRAARSWRVRGASCGTGPVASAGSVPEVSRAERSTNDTPRVYGPLPYAASAALANRRRRDGSHWPHASKSCWKTYVAELMVLA